MSELQAPSVQLKLNTKTIKRSEIVNEEFAFEIDALKFRAFLEGVYNINEQ